MAPAPPPADDAPAVSVVAVTAEAGGLVYVMVRLPDGKRRRLCIPRGLVTIANVQICAAALLVLVEMET